MTSRPTTCALRTFLLSLVTAALLSSLAGAQTTATATDPGVGPVQLTDPAVGPVQLTDPGVGPVQLGAVPTPSGS